MRNLLCILGFHRWAYTLKTYASFNYRKVSSECQRPGCKAGKSEIVRTDTVRHVPHTDNIDYHFSDLKHVDERREYPVKKFDVPG